MHKGRAAVASFKTLYYLRSKRQKGNITKYAYFSYDINIHNTGCGIKNKIIKPENDFANKVILSSSYLSIPSVEYKIIFFENHINIIF